MAEECSQWLVDSSRLCLLGKEGSCDVRDDVMSGATGNWQERARWDEIATCPEISADRPPGKDNKKENNERCSFWLKRLTDSVCLW